MATEHWQLATVMTICHLLHSLHVGGAEMLAARLGRRFAGTYRVIFICLDELGTLGQELQQQGFVVHVLNRRQPGFDWRCAARLGTILRREKVDLIHAHQYTPFFYALSGRWFHRRSPILFLEHGRHQPDYPRRKRIIANRLLLERRDRVIGVGEAVRRALIANEGIPKVRVGVVYNGIDLKSFANANGKRSAIRHELNLSTEAFVAIQVARLDPIKDHGTAIQGFAKIAARYPQARFLLVGDGPERKFIELMVERLGMQDRIRLLGTRTDVKRLLSAADLFLLSSISEGIPLTLIEAMAAGLPVVATRVGGVPEVVEDGVTGLLAPAGDADAIGDRLNTLAENRDLRTEMGRRGLGRAQALFSEDKMVASYDSLYREMLEQ